MVSFGLHALGLVFDDIPEFAQNISILKKLAVVFNTKVFFYGTPTKMHSFDLEVYPDRCINTKSLKQESVKTAKGSPFQLIKVESTIPVAIPLSDTYEGIQSSLAK